MKLASFEVGGRASDGIVVGDGIVDVGARLGARYPTLRAAIAGDALDEIARSAEAKADLAFSAVRLVPPIPAPDKIVCIGLNYRACFCGSPTPWCRTAARWCGRPCPPTWITRANSRS